MTVAVNDLRLDALYVVYPGAPSGIDRPEVWLQRFGFTFECWVHVVCVRGSAGWIGLRAARELVEHLEDADILVTGKESIPTWDGRPLDLPYVMECLWKPPPHLEAAVARERETSRAA